MYAFTGKWQTVSKHAKVGVVQKLGDPYLDIQNHSFPVDVS